jgi:plastocyanin
MISWTNYDPTPHTVTSDDGLFNSGPLAPGQSFSYTFDVGGTFTYHCQIEPNIHGSITVFSPLLSPK